MYYWIIGIVAVIVVLSLFKPFQTRNSFKNKNIIITGASTYVFIPLLYLITIFSSLSLFITSIFIYLIFAVI